MRSTFRHDIPNISIKHIENGKNGNDSDNFRLKSNSNNRFYKWDKNLRNRCEDINTDIIENDLISRMNKRTSKECHILQHKK